MELLLDTNTHTIFINYEKGCLYSLNPSASAETLDKIGKKIFRKELKGYRKITYKYSELHSEYKKTHILQEAFDLLLKNNELKFIQNYEDADSLIKKCELLQSFIKYCWEENFSYNVDFEKWEISIQGDFLVNVAQEKCILFAKNKYILTSEWGLEVQNYILPTNEEEEDIWDDNEIY